MGRASGGGYWALALLAVVLIVGGTCDGLLRLYRYRHTPLDQPMTVVVRGPRWRPDAAAGRADSTTPRARLLRSAAVVACGFVVLAVAFVGIRFSLPDRA